MSNFRKYARGGPLPLPPPILDTGVLDSGGGRKRSKTRSIEQVRTVDDSSHPAAAPGSGRHPRGPVHHPHPPTAPTASPAGLPGFPAGSCPPSSAPSATYTPTAPPAAGQRQPAPLTSLVCTAAPLHPPGQQVQHLVLVAHPPSAVPHPPLPAVPTASPAANSTAPPWSAGLLGFPAGPRPPSSTSSAPYGLHSLTCSRPTSADSPSPPGLHGQPPGFAGAAPSRRPGSPAYLWGSKTEAVKEPIGDKVKEEIEEFYRSITRDGKQPSKSFNRYSPEDLLQGDQVPTDHLPVCQGCVPHRGGRLACPSLS